MTYELYPKNSLLYDVAEKIEYLVAGVRVEREYADSPELAEKHKSLSLTYKLVAKHLNIDTDELGMRILERTFLRRYEHSVAHTKNSIDNLLNKDGACIAQILTGAGINLVRIQNSKESSNSNDEKT